MTSLSLVASRRGLVLFLTLAVLLPGCRAWKQWRTGKTPEQSAFGYSDKRSAAEVAPYLAVARAIITHRDLPAPPMLPGQRVFVTWWSPGHSAVRATGLGATLFESVQLASATVAAHASGDGRIELDVVTLVRPGSIDDDASRPPHQFGLHGYAIYDDDSFGWVTPSEIIFDRLVDTRDERPTKLRASAIEALLTSRGGVGSPATSKMTKARFEVSQWLEAEKAGQSPIQLFRSMPPHVSELSADDLLGAAREAADYVARSCDDEGKFVYLYDPVRDRVERGYDIIRHVGAIYALMDAYDLLREPAWKTAAERAIGYLQRQLRTSPNGRFLLQSERDEQQKAGATGLALIALAKYAQTTGDKGRMDEMRSLAGFLLHQQYPDGHFRANADVKREDPEADTTRRPKEVSYYPGEATLGLIRLYAIDADPKWLEGARRGADYVIFVRDARADEASQIHDHWMSYALLDLYQDTHEARYADHLLKIARAIVLGELRGATAEQPDYVGAFYDPGTTTPSSTRLEALAAAIQLSRVLGKSDAWLRGPAMELSAFMRGQQLVGDNLYFAMNPERARGGLRGSLLTSDVRIDYPQHALSGWLHFAEELRESRAGISK